MPAVVSGIFSGKNYKTGKSEYKVSLIADGMTVSAKFHRSWEVDRVEETAKLLKDEKMQSMLLFTIIPGTFKDRQTGRQISYYTIIDVTRPKISPSEIINGGGSDHEN